MMNSGKTLPDFRPGQILKADSLATITGMIGGVVRTNSTEVFRPLNLQIKFKTALAAATATLTSPATATAYVLRKNSSGNLVVTAEEITVVNRFRSHNHEVNTFAKVEWQDGEWQVYAAECPGYTI